MNKLFSSAKLLIAVSYIGLYLISSGASMLIFSYLSDGPSMDLTSGDLDDQRSKINLDLPKTEECPINGGMFTKIEKSIWEDKRPIAAIIENHTEARPQSGLSRADVVYEAVAEGGITRFLAIYYCGAAKEDVEIAPVRSARVYFINLAAGYGKNPIFMHVGGANDYSGLGETIKEARALELLESMGWRVPKGNDFDTTYDSGFPVFWRNYERLNRQVATEHTMMASLDAAYTVAEKRGFKDKDSKGIAWDSIFKPWKFVDGKSESQVVKEIKFGFWENKPDYDVTWKYNPVDNSYQRYNGGTAHKDLHDDSSLTSKNVVIVFAKERVSVDINKHSLYEVVGTGSALVFQNGVAIEGDWEKKSQSDSMIFKDSKGKEISLVRGTTWVEILATGTDVEY